MKQYLRPFPMSFLGEREYVHSTTLFASLMLGLEEVGFDWNSVVRYRIPKLIVHGGRWQLIPDANRETVPADYSAALDMSASSGSHTAYFVEDGSEITTRCPEQDFPIRELTYQGPFSGSIALASVRHMSDFFRTLVEANKRLHSKELTDRATTTSGIRFIYVENLPRLTSWLNSDEQRLCIRHVGLRAAGDRTYTLNTVNIVGAKGGVTKICFSY